jgi:predicted small secreted protein
MKTGKFIAFGIAVLILTSVLSCSVWAATELSKEKIIEIAQEKVLAMGEDLAAMTVTYDVGNEMLKKHLMRVGVSQYNKQTKSWDAVQGTTPEAWRPKLKNRAYQAVYFAPKQQMKGGDFWVFVDLNTGEVIDSVGGK